MNFKELNLIPQILKAVEEVGYETPSPIQEKAIPPVLAGRDLLGCAQTGTGKTAAFAMPILQNLMQSRPAGRVIRTLILTPTRELALQIFENLEEYGKHLPLKSCVIFGGVGQTPQVDKIKRGVDILVATPGRLLDLVSQGVIKLGSIEIFVLDEADRMLDMGFVHDVKRILKLLPAKKQTLLFSATMPKEIEDLASSLLHNPQEVYVTPPATTVEKIEQSLYKVDKVNKRLLLADILKDKSIQSALVFTRTKHGADKVVRELEKDKIIAMAIHGNKSQGARQTALSAFKNGELRVLVATDIAARGIDINELSHVINYDLPDVPETYVHRIGRTGRAGQTGTSISFCCFDELSELADIEKLIGFKLPEVMQHSYPMEVFESLKKPQQARPPRSERQNQGKQAQKTPNQNPKQASKQGSKPTKNAERAAAQKEEKAQKPKTNYSAYAPGATVDDGKYKHKIKSGTKQPSRSTNAPAQTSQPSKKRGERSNSNSELNIIRKTSSQKFTSFDDYFKANK